uniref:STAG domain-containing protein n=1 Tax=Petromyzon marinus TaxID=7757 RepID=S4RII0_PETMA
CLQTVVDTWVDSYKEDQDEATLSLINFFIQSSGCKGCVTMDMYRTMEYADIIRKMTEGFDEESAEYPLSQAGLQAKRFRTVLADFVLMLVRQSRNGPLYDLKEMLLGLLTGLTDSQVRAFRHTATFA